MKTPHVLAGAAAFAATALFLVLPFAADAVTPTTWTVDGQAGDACTSATLNCTTIQNAIDASSNGDTINVNSGTYTEDVNVNKSVTLKGESGAKLVVVDGASSNGFSVTANNVTIEGFDIDGPVTSSYQTYTWGSNVSRGIVINNGVTNFTITDNTVQNLRNDILVDGRNTGAITDNVIDNSKSGISVQYTDAGAGNTEGYNVTISGNTQGTFGNDWGLNLHLNGDINTVPAFTNSQKIATDAPAGVQAALLANSAANDGWSVQDQGYSENNRTSVVVGPTGASTNQGDPLGPLDTIQNGVNAVIASGTVNVLNGSYNGAVNITQKVQVIGQSEAGVIVNQNAGTPFGDGITVTAADGVGLSNMTFTTPNHAPMSYAFHSYQATNLSLSNLTFNGNGSHQSSGSGIGGVDINSTSGVSINNVNVSDYTKNGFSFTAQNISTDPVTGNLSLSGLTSNGNAWDGIAFYTESSGGNGKNISDVNFSGTNTFTDNTQGGLYVEGDTDANAATFANPRFTVTTDGTTLYLDDAVFNSNPAYDIINYQTAPVSALDATFGGITGDNMTGAQRTTENGMIIDQLDHSALGLVTYYTYSNNPSESQFEESPIYVRSNNAGDIAAIALVPAEATAAQFTFTQTDGSNVYTDVAGTEHVQAGQFPIPATGQHQYRVGVSAAAGAYDVTGEYEVSGTWYPITGSAITYALDNPVASFVFPTAGDDTFRSTDNPARVTVDDTNDSFSDVVFNVDGTNYEVDRANCDLREAGNRVLCDVDEASNWPGTLSGGTHTVSALVYNQARGNTEVASTNFTIDDTRPDLTNFVITNPSATYSNEIDVSADATDDTGVANVEFYVTVPRAGDGVCDGNGTPLVNDTITSPSSGDTYTDALDTSALASGNYCVNATAEDIAGNHSLPVQTIAVTISSPSVTTDAANPINALDATLNGTNGSMAADNTSFWYGPGTAGPFTSGPNPAAAQFPAGWSSTGVNPAAGANAAFDQQVIGLTPNTTYSFVAWSEIGGIWYPGTVLSFETVNGTTPTVTTEAATSIDSTDETLNATDGTSDGVNTSFWYGPTSAGPFTSGPNPAASQFPAGWTSTGVNPAVTAGNTFDSSISGLTAGTPYYYAAWVYVGGIWYPGSVLNFMTLSDATVTTDIASNVTPSDAQLNGMVGPSAATQVSFWVSTSTFPTTSPAIPAGVYSTQVTNTVAANTAFSDQLSSLVTSGIPNNLPAVEPNTTYYYVAWANVGGTWYPGAELNFTTGNGPAVGTPGVTTDAATNPSDTDATLNATNGGVAADAESFWVSTSSIDDSNPNSIPTGVYSTQVITDPTELATSSPFSDQLSDVTNSGIPGNMMAITPSTTYYYVAWSNVNGTWYNGGQQMVTTSAAPLQAPIANSDSATTNLATEVTIPVLANDSNSPTGITALTQPANGTASIDVDGTDIDYTPNANFSGQDTFTYEATNSVGTSSPATVTVTVKDTSTPVLTLVGANPLYVTVGGAYNELGVHISDPASNNNLDYFISVDGGAAIEEPPTFTSADVDTSAPETHTLTYTATNSGGNTGSTTRSVIVLSPLSIVLTSTSATDTTISDNPIAVTATFSGPVQSFTTGDITVTNGAASGVQLNASSTAATFNVLPAANGTVTVTIPAGDVTDMAGSATTTDTTISFTYAAATQNNSNNNNNNGGGGGGGGGGGSSNGAPSQTFSKFDLNHDGKVNLLDLNILFENWGKTGANIPGDFNGDGVVNLLDLNLFLANWLG